MASAQLFEALQKHDPASTAIVHSLSGRTFTYGSLVEDVDSAREKLSRQMNREGKGIAGERIAFLAENSYDYVGGCDVVSRLQSANSLDE